MLTELELRLMWIGRWGVIHTVHKQSVAEHCYFVARLAAKIANLMGIQNPWLLLEIQGYALRHDDLESITNDITPIAKPAFKSAVMEEIYRKYLPTERVSKQAYDIVKIADIMEACIFLFVEHSIGNTSIMPFIEAMEEQLLDTCGTYGMMKVWDEYDRWRNVQFPNGIMMQNTYTKENIRESEQSTTGSASS